MLKRHTFKEIDIIICDNNTITVFDKAHHFRQHIVSVDIWECIMRCCSIENKRISFIHHYHDKYYECYISPNKDRLIEMYNNTQYDSNMIHNTIIDTNDLINHTNDVRELYATYCG